MGPDSSRTMQMLTVVYQAGPNAEKQYASVPMSADYKDVMTSACECFEEYLPPDWKSCRLELQHEIQGGHWALIHPNVFSTVTASAVKIKLRVRQVTQDLSSREQSGVHATRRPKDRSTNGSLSKPPSYVKVPQYSAPSPLALVLDRPEIPITDVQHSIYCDRCKHMISGVRYHCSTCPSLDYCAVCIGFAPLEHAHRFEAIINGSTRLFRPMDAHFITGLKLKDDEHRPNKTEHNALCDICDARIVGTRFKCAVCSDWDTCEKCLEQSLELHPKHTFIRVVDHTVLILRDKRRGETKHTRIICDGCTKGISGSSFYQCKAFLCPIKYLCDDCGAQSSRPCDHALVKRRV